MRHSRRRGNQIVPIIIVIALALSFVLLTVVVRSGSQDIRSQAKELGSPEAIVRGYFPNGENTACILQLNQPNGPTKAECEARLPNLQRVDDNPANDGVAQNSSQSDSQQPSQNTPANDPAGFVCNQSTMGQACSTSTICENVISDQFSGGTTYRCVGWEETIAVYILNATKTDCVRDPSRTTGGMTLGACKRSIENYCAPPMWQCSPGFRCEPQNPAYGLCILNTNNTYIPSDCRSKCVAQYANNPTEQNRCLTSCSPVGGQNVTTNTDTSSGQRNQASDNTTTTGVPPSTTTSNTQLSTQTTNQPTCAQWCSGCGGFCGDEGIAQGIQCSSQ